MASKSRVRLLANLFAGRKTAVATRVPQSAALRLINAGQLTGEPCFWDRSSWPYALPSRGRWLSTGVTDEPDQEETEKQLSESEELIKELAHFQSLPEAETGAPANQTRFKELGTAIQVILVDGAIPDRLSVLRSLADLAALPGKPFNVTAYFLAFLEGFTEDFETLRENETITDRARDLQDVFRSFHRSGVVTERIRLLYSHIENDFPRFELEGPELLPLPPAVSLLHTMLSTGLSGAPAVLVLLRSALREPLMNYTDDSHVLRQLKTIEMLLRVDFLHTLRVLPEDVHEYLGIVRSLRYYDRELRRDTTLSYQLAYFLRKHEFPARRQMLGPYALKVCDPEARVCFEPREERTFRQGMPEVPPARKVRHLQALGWRVVEVYASVWRTLEDYDAKAAHVRELLKQNEMLDT